MLVKKTKSGKFSFRLDYTDRDEVASDIINYLEDESIKLMKERVEKNPSRHLAYAIANDFYLRNASKLNSPHKYERFLITRAEAIFLLVLLGQVAGVELRNVRAELHKLLS